MSDPATSIKYMFDTKQPGGDPGATTRQPHPGPAEGVPLERLEARICELAGHLAAATCRFLVLLGDFDARRGWESWEMGSCAAWLSWKCQMGSGAALACTAALSGMIHDHDGTVLDLGRRRRRPTSALRRAARERDHCRCRYPGCESRRTGLHHIRYWANGGRTSLDKLIHLCKRHHLLIHDRGYLIAARPGGTFTFYQPDGTPLPASPAPPAPDGTIQDCHDAGITPDTIIPPWYGEHLDLDYAIHACLAHADCQARRRDRQDQREHAQPDPQDDHAPQAPPRQPETTGVNIFTAIRPGMRETRTQLTSRRRRPARP